MSSLFAVALVIAASIFVARNLFREGKGSSSGEDLQRKMDIPADSRAAFIVCTFSMLGHIAEADGRVSAEELEKIEHYIATRLKLDRRTKKLALKVLAEASQSPLELRDYAEKFRATYPDRVQLADKMVEILVEIAAVDRRLTAREDELIRSAALLLGLSEPAYERIKGKYLAPAVLH